MTTFFKIGDIVKETNTGKIGKIIKVCAYIDNAVGKIDYEIRLNGGHYCVSAFDTEETTEQETNNYLINEVVDRL